MSESSLRTQPQELAVTHQDAGVRIALRVPEDLCYFEGHFPGLPILPGVVQLKWAIDYGRRFFDLPPRFVSLSNIKFMRVIVPGRIVTLNLGRRSQDAGLAFEYDIDGDTCSAGVVNFAA